MYRAALCLLVVAACGAPTPRSPACTPASIIVRTGEGFTGAEDVERVLRVAAEHGVESVSVLVKSDEDEADRPSGLAFYASDIAPIDPSYTDFDVLEAAVRIGHERGMRVVAWVPQFHDSAGLRVDESWSMQARIDDAIVPYVGRNGERFLSPADPGAQAYELSIIEELVTRYPVDGVMIDWVRYDGWNTGMEPATRDGFLRETGIDVSTTDVAADPASRELWRVYRARVVAAYVHSVRELLDRVRPGIELGVYALPLDFAEVSQDVALFAADLDVVSPMLYFDDWSFPPSWVAESTRAFRERAGTRARVLPVLDEDWTDEAYTTVLTELGALDPAVSGVAWFAFGAWDDDLIAHLARPAVCVR